jgi:serpin B
MPCWSSIGTMKNAGLVGLFCLVACQGTSTPPPSSSVVPETKTSVSAVPSAPVATVIVDASVATAPTEAISASVATSSNGLAVDLYGKLKSKPGNLFYSPVSISMALMMAYGGANGATRTAMGKVLHLSDGITQANYGSLITQLSSTNNGPTLTLANRVYADQTLHVEPDYLTLTRDVYKAPLELVDFKNKTEDARLSINGWVEKQTNSKIKDLIAPNTIDSSVKLVLVNAIYFKGKWATPFVANDTKPAPFYAASGTKSAPTMHLHTKAKYAETRDMQSIELPYTDPSTTHALVMDILLPRQKNGLVAMESAMATGLNAMLPAGSFGDPTFDIALPKFNMLLDFELGKTLGDLGMGIAFGKDADFSGISKPTSPEDRLRVAKVIHKAFVEVNEEGTEAAAATGLMLQGGTGPAPEVKPFVVDHPFVFLIRDAQSGVVLFMGRVADPTGSP